MTSEVVWPTSLIQQSYLEPVDCIFLNISNNGKSTAFPGMDAYFQQSNKSELWKAFEEVPCLIRLDNKPKSYGMLSGSKLCLFTCMFNVVFRLKMGSSFAAWAPCLLDRNSLWLFLSTRGGLESAFIWGRPETAGWSSHGMCGFFLLRIAEQDGSQMSREANSQCRKTQFIQVKCSAL